MYIYSGVYLTCIWRTNMKTHYKKAFSLLELLISMSIIISVFSLGFKGKRVLDQTINNIKAHTAVSNMCDFLSYSKFYCNKNNSSVIINCRNIAAYSGTVFSHIVRILCVSNKIGIAKNNIKNAENFALRHTSLCI